MAEDTVFTDARDALMRTRSHLVYELHLISTRLAKVDAAIAALSDDNTAPVLRDADAGSIRVTTGKATARLTNTVPPARLAGGGYEMKGLASSAEPSIKDAVLAALRSTPLPLGVDELRARMEAEGLRGDRTDKQINNTIRSALFNLRKADLARSVGGGKNIASEYAEAWDTIEPVDPHNPFELSEDVSESPGPAGQTNDDESGEVV